MIIVVDKVSPRQGGLRTAFDQSGAQRLFSKISNLVASDRFLKIPPEALFLRCALSEKNIIDSKFFILISLMI